MAGRQDTGTLHTGLDHLPSDKRWRLAWALNVLIEAFETAVARGARKGG
ncbi:MAG: hypothetical protein Q8Q88_06655 [Phenylobacterium sp.]|nr:hypothetical protein [Phenylobacterium sp.]MDP3746715.1 hypothetical protein [Phenylobacterium sp.]